ncbi:MAG TPA: hypothetical protein VIG99_30410 [Myxococcaceae bacterium]|jgi:hypothetical protein
MRSAAALLALALSLPAHAWLLPEHDRLAAAGIRLLGTEDRQLLQEAWARGLAAAGPRFCSDAGQELSQRSVPDDSRGCAGFSALTALAGDHSCTPDELAATVESAPWVGPLLLNSRELGDLFFRLPADDQERVSAWREHNLALQQIDPLYVARAQNNAAHFLRVREGESTLDSYLQGSLAAGGKLNAVAIYAHFHRVALRAAARAAPGCAREGEAWRCGEAAAKDLRRALLAEAFAEHFLEDSFSAGHIVGSWGDVGQRLGTHDYYSEHGLDARTWSGEIYSARGDAFLSAEDERRGAAAVAESLGQLAAALRGGAAEGGSDQDLLVCQAATTVPAGLEPSPQLAEVVRDEPIPVSRAHGAPRFRSEVGLFFGLSLDGSGFALLRGSGLGYSDVRLRLGLGAGLALEGAFSRFMDGQLFVDLLLVASMHEYAVARRGIGFGVRVRMPFVVLPGDLLYLVAPSAIVNPDFAYQLAQIAVAGGLGRLQRQFILRKTLSAQWMLGREVTASWLPEVGWTVDVPVFQLSGDRLFNGAFATETVVQVGGTLHVGPASLLGGSSVLGGVVIGVSERIRRYTPQDCGKDCED